MASQGYSYDNNLQYDYLGNKGTLSGAIDQQIGEMLYQEGRDPEGVKAGNVFYSDKNQTLRAVSAFTTYNTLTTITTSVYLLEDNFTNPEDGTLLLTQTDNIRNNGITTLKLAEPVEISEGQIFSVVQNIVYSDLKDADGNIIEQAGIPLEFGSKEPYDRESEDEDGNPVTITYDFKTYVAPKTSYVCGVLKNDTNWYQTSDERVKEEFEFPLYVLGTFDTVSVPGSVMIKAYTTDDTPPTGTSLNEENIYLATTPGAITSRNITATLTPADASTPITWEIGDNNIATVTGRGTTATIQAVNEGYTTLTVTAENLSATATVYVNNSDVVCTRLDITPNGPDYYTLTARDVISNPALNATGEVKRVSMFSWSEPNQADINAKVAQNIPGTNDWQFENFPINDNAVNNYFVHADRILINVYGSLDESSDGNLIGVGSYAWINPTSAGENTIGYIGYSENLGFVKPTGFSGSLAGTTGRALHLEGLRISSNVEGVEITTRVHVQNLGWLSSCSDGTYAGTMHRDLGIEGIELTLEGEKASEYRLTYRVYQENVGWQDWVSAGELAGSTGRNLQIEAIEINLEKI